MVNNQLLYEATQRLRYETFAKMSAEVNAAADLTRVAQSLASNLKYIVDASACRLLVAYENQVVSIETARAQWQVRAEGVAFTPFEQRVLATGVPIVQTDDQGGVLPLYGKPLAHLCFFPVVMQPGQQLLLIVGCKVPEAYNETDFRFFRLIGQLMLNRITSLLVLQHLEQIVSVRTQELRQANQELNTLFYRLSHNFRRPLTSLMGLFGLIRTITPEPQVHDMLGKCNEVLSGMDAMLRKLSTLSEVEAVEQLRMPLNFYSIVEMLRLHYQPALQDKQIALDVVIEVTQEVHFYAFVVHALLQNLLENAIFFLGQHPSPVRRIGVQIRAHQGELELSVHDNGPGISPAIQEKVFELYYKGDVTSKGEGLGLYVVKKIAERYAGTVALHSPATGGTQVVIRFALPEA
ncbi:Signal transduction histidine kinase [Catalinimonas alkaloidigena]|uniref:histidine kinase n=1 Tax=Catalinimonas alkaloidigena TaxID=1075417 RepID=A0A1G8XG80_9BACT|nr:HAMP domain-containing sensor histidine kinase [Catalinimonas alkaloidigena]SDJ89649.1 Signal transduction histidine kinase [Catalinimonas alkaloidigena]